ncbi:MAG: hypothetical protein IMZ50_09970 [Candidatus Atribacteria bacterium]|nr:hypothetical protein [Candidatus Atribacteria bacterium]
MPTDLTGPEQADRVARRMPGWKEMFDGLLKGAWRMPNGRLRWTKGYMPENRTSYFRPGRDVADAMEAIRLLKPRRWRLEGTAGHGVCCTIGSVCGECEFSETNDDSDLALCQAVCRAVEKLPDLARIEAACQAAREGRGGSVDDILRRVEAVEQLP